MKKNLIVLTATLLITLTVKGQNLFFIVEDSYLCTESITLQANSEDKSDLIVSLGYDGLSNVFTVSVEFWTPAMFGEELIIYLNNGKVITCDNGGITDYVDDSAIGAYILTDDQLNKMKNSDIHTVRYNLTNGLLEWNYSASNKGTSTKSIITKFFD